jgi:hypothetical protein
VITGDQCTLYGQRIRPYWRQHIVDDLIRQYSIEDDKSFPTHSYRP